MARKNPAYSLSDLQKWEADMRLTQPGAPSAGPMYVGAIITSISCAHADTGMMLVLANDQGQRQTVFLNPVVASALLRGIQACGAAGQWLHAHGEVRRPFLPKG